MRTNEIRKMIRAAITDEEQTSRLANTTRDVIRSRGGNPSNEEVQNIVDFVRGYIEHVPFYLEEAAKAAGQLGLSAELGQMAGELEAYWFDANDLIPDHLGLIGLTDDAYASLMLLQSLSDYCQATVGRPLLPQNFTPANQAIRQMIGEPLVSHLEQRLGVTIANAMMQKVMGQVVNAGFTFGAAPDPIWGNASIEEIVNTKMGAMGIV